jgi:glycosyltransferase involved in cell wall biosynthesis
MEMGLKICILTSYLYHNVKEIHGKDRIIWGGAERYLFELCKLLKEDGHDVVVYQSLPQTVRDENGVARKVHCGQITKEFAGAQVVCLPDTEDGWQYSTNPRLNMIFNELAIFADLVVYFATFLCHPHVVHPSISISHGIFWDYPNHAIRNSKKDEQEEFFRRQLYGFTAPDACIAVDSNVRKVLAAMDPGSESRVHVIYNFCDTEKFKPAPKTWEGTRVLYPRRLTMLRGCNEFIKASRELPEYEFIAVGQAADEGMEKQVVAWGDTTPNIRFVYKPMEGMEEVYQGADISVVPTRASEGLSLSLLESMACGLPIITTPVGGLGDAVIDGYNGLIFDPNYESLTNYIRYLAENEDLRYKFGERNREIACNCFDIEIWREKWRNLIKRFC